MTRRWSLGVLGIALMAGPAAAQEGPDLTEVLRDLRTAAPEGRPAAVARAAALAPDPDLVVAILRSGVHPSAAPAPGWSIQSAVDAAGVARPYHLYVPAAVATGSVPAPLLVHMHGGISRPDFVDHQTFEQWRGLWVDQADRLGIVLALPLGRADCAWWTAAGVGHVEAVVRDVKRRAAIDDDRCCATGFSDGGSGAYFFALAAPDPWAALLPMNGHPAVAAAASGRQLYPENTALADLFVAHTANDSLYPVTTVMPHWQAFLEHGAAMHVVLYPTGDHSPAYFDEQGPALAAFVRAARRDGPPPLLEWRTADPATGRVRWLAVTAIGPAPGDAPDPGNANVLSRPGRVRLGVNVNEAVDADGVEVTQVVPGSNAERLGLRTGDRIRGIDDQDVGKRRHLVAALQRKAHGDPIRVRVTRAGVPDVIELQGTLAPFSPEPVYARTAPTAWIKAVAYGSTVDVQSRNVQRFSLEVRPELLDLADPVTVRVNGVVRFHGRVSVDLEGLLRGYAARADGGRLTLATLAIDCTTPAPADRGEGF